MNMMQVFRVGDLIVAKENPEIRFVVVALRPAENGGGYWVTRDQGSTIRLSPHNVDKFEVLARSKKMADSLRRIEQKIEGDRQLRRKIIERIFAGDFGESGDVH